MGSNSENCFNKMAAQMGRRRIEHEAQVVRDINERQRQQMLAIEQANEQNKQRILGDQERKQQLEQLTGEVQQLVEKNQILTTQNQQLIEQNQSLLNVMQTLANPFDELLLGFAKEGDLEKAKAVITLGANIEILSQEGLTPFFISLKNGHDLLTDLFIKNGANQQPVNLAQQAVLDKLNAKNKGSGNSLFFVPRQLQEKEELKISSNPLSMEKHQYAKCL